MVLSTQLQYEPQVRSELTTATEINLPAQDTDILGNERPTIIEIVIIYDKMLKHLILQFKDIFIQLSFFFVAVIIFAFAKTFWIMHSQASFRYTIRMKRDGFLFRQFKTKNQKQIVHLKRSSKWGGRDVLKMTKIAKRNKKA